ncbi:Uncharacterised protein [uncultured Leptotrichia sp.]|jgi:hypothetical protein|uniref:hypothetical protein n=1 Tax=uncultured Leptotrichia sp. TaxID=159271 RepID=UPI001A54665D|nr:hypothetical protein [uncultured Leptotrichia sp.]VTX62039.1 Uncharacterised protein [uncultured Leptotrichia sp.]
MKHKIIKEFIGSINGYIIDDENLYDSLIYFINYLEDIFKLEVISSDIIEYLDNCYDTYRDVIMDEKDSDILDVNWIITKFLMGITKNTGVKFETDIYENTIYKKMASIFKEDDLAGYIDIIKGVMKK